MERKQIELDFSKVKCAVKESQLDWFIEESPFSARIFMKKKRLIDWKNPILKPTISTPTPNSQQCSLPSSCGTPGLQDSFPSFDSGFRQMQIDEKESKIKELTQKLDKLKLMRKQIL